MRILTRDNFSLQQPIRQHSALGNCCDFSIFEISVDKKLIGVLVPFTFGASRSVRRYTCSLVELTFPVVASVYISLRVAPWLKTRMNVGLVDSRLSAALSNLIAYPPSVCLFRLFLCFNRWKSTGQQKRGYRLQRIPLAVAFPAQRPRAGLSASWGARHGDCYFYETRAAACVLKDSGKTLVLLRVHLWSRKLELNCRKLAGWW